VLKADTLMPDTGLKLPVELREVSIKGFRNTRPDSINNRKAFANAFAYKAPGFTDLFSQKVRLKTEYSAFQPSTSSLLGINLLTLPGLFGKHNSPPGKLKSKLLTEEKDVFVDRVFSKKLVESVTGLQGDSLEIFRTRYRPDYLMAKKTTAYDMILYIKKSLGDFTKTTGQR
jgi:hypothetical protein